MDDLSIENLEKYLDKIRGCLIGGASGDALGFPVEFLSEDKIFLQFGKDGITKYKFDSKSCNALVSDDTQMSLFTANGILVGQTRAHLRGIYGKTTEYVAKAYDDWITTQTETFESVQKSKLNGRSWLLNVKELFACRAPGMTCLSALQQYRKTKNYGTIKTPINDSKGCGGIMRVAPLALAYQPGKNRDITIEELDMEGAEIAAITHGHSLGFMSAAILVHIINRLLTNQKNLALKEIVLEAEKTVLNLFKNDKHIEELVSIINLAVELSENNDSDLENIHKLGEGWVAEETLAIAIYCALKYQNNFSKGIIAAVNHNGDSDSTGAVAGNILGLIVGYKNIESKWKENLELKDVVLEIADDLCFGCKITEFENYQDNAWIKKYTERKRK